MKEIRTDMGTEYINETLTELNKLFDINHMMSTPYRPQTVGTVERNHRVLNEYLRMYINDYIIDWDT
jgi:transposase InsO family protein